MLDGVFILNSDPVKAARLLCDRHLLSQSKEAVQILYTALHKLGLAVTGPVHIPGCIGGDVVHEEPWKPARTHPCVDWAMSGTGALRWITTHGHAIMDEFEQRNGRKLKAEYHLEHIELHLKRHLEANRLPAEPATGAAWLDKLSEADRMRVEPCLSTVNAPEYAGYGVVAMDPEFVISDDQGRIDCVASYLKFYVHKAKHQFVMKWRRELQAPPAIAAAFAVYDPDTPPLTASKKRKVLNDEAAFPEAAALSSVVAAVAAA